MVDVRLMFCVLLVVLIAAPEKRRRRIFFHFQKAERPTGATQGVRWIGPTVRK